ncbi:MAG TPA: hypothetical protein VMR37_07470, partial [Rhabdochlamydiaceae bacterium]|nr:hypothetical protein [Rhabdochlamydiaceae bacterium]
GARGGQVTPVATSNQGPAAPRTGVWNTMVSFFGGNEGSPPPASPAQPTAAKSPASTSTSSPSSASAMGGSPNSPSRTAAPPLSPAAATSSDEKTPPVAPVSPAAANGKKPSTMARVFFGKVAGKRGILFEKTDYGFRLGGDWSLKDLKAYGLNFPATVDSDFDEDTIDSYLFNYNAKMAPKTGQKFDFNTGKKNEAFEIEVEKVSGISVDIVKVMVVTESKAGESGAQSASSN